MPASRVKDSYVLIAAGILTVALGVAAALIDPPGGSGTHTPSSFSTTAEGAKAAFGTLSALGYEIERSFEPMAVLDLDAKRTALVITGTTPPSEQDRRAFRMFLETGGVALVVGPHGADFLDVGDAAPEMPFLGKPSTHRPLAPSPLVSHVSEITMTTTGGMPKFGAAHVALFAVSPQEPLVTTARVGQGRVSWWAAATPLTNAHIASASNLQLLLNVLGAPGERRVLWDEHYHGHSRSLWSYAARTPLPWIGAQAGLLLVAVFATHSRRRGPVRSSATRPRTSSLEFIEMLGALYGRGDANGAAVTSARNRFRRSVTASCGIPHEASDDAMAGMMASRFGVDARAVSNVLGASARAERETALTSQDALKLTQQLQKLTAVLSRPS
jgi:hypothetical protein